MINKNKEIAVLSTVPLMVIVWFLTKEFVLVLCRFLKVFLFKAGFPDLNDKCLDIF